VLTSRSTRVIMVVFIKRGFSNISKHLQRYSFKGRDSGKNLRLQYFIARAFCDPCPFADLNITIT
jgi:hypothetical protein